jgi:hypothetical protein
VALVRTDVSEELGASFIRVTRIDELGTTQAATSNLRTQRMSVLTRAKRRNIPEDTSLHSHRRENLKSYNVVPSSLILVTLIMEVLRLSETSVITRATRRNIVGDCILHSHHRENLKSYICGFRLDQPNITGHCIEHLFVWKWYHFFVGAHNWR